MQLDLEERSRHVAGRESMPSARSLLLALSPLESACLAGHNNPAGPPDSESRKERKAECLHQIRSVENGLFFSQSCLCEEQQCKKIDN